MKNKGLNLLLLAIAITATITVDAQFGSGGSAPGTGGTGGGIPGAGGAGSSGPTVPFDGGMSLVLLASGVGYAAKRIKKVNT
ncbi:hypothetical protein [Parasediminibacterium sp. JCM 36343]|uniref:hypothetical protein n=1 Tax=Parasediminibacterium sp. JCM 36343 TaxID=3374279 RepID=UPI00397A5FE8